VISRRKSKPVADCYICGWPAAADADQRNPLCTPCLPARDHVVSMTRGSPPLPYVADCRCGWTSAAADYDERELFVRAHWLRVIADARDAA
jgi:hypothetical protein